MKAFEKLGLSKTQASELSTELSTKAVLAAHGITTTQRRLERGCCTAVEG